MKATLDDLKLELWIRYRNSGSIKWKTKKGDEIPINEMSNIHLINTIEMIQSKDNYLDALGSIGDTNLD